MPFHSRWHIFAFTCHSLHFPRVCISDLSLISQRWHWLKHELSDQLFDYISVSCPNRNVICFFIQGFERDGQLNFSGEVVACHAC